MSSESLALSEVEWVETSLIVSENIQRFDSLTSRSLSLRPSRLCRGPPATPFSMEPVLSGVEGLGMTKRAASKEFSIPLAMAEAISIGTRRNTRPVTQIVRIDRADFAIIESLPLHLRTTISI